VASTLLLAAAALLVAAPAARGLPYLASPSWDTSGSAPGGLLGSVVSAAGDVNGDGFDDVLARSATGPSGAGAGSVQLFLGSPSGPAAGPSASPDWSFAGADPAGALGAAVAIVPDCTGDGRDEWLAGSPFEGEGRLRVWFGADPLPAPDSAPELEIPGPAAWGDSAFGSSLASAGDIDGDGLLDLAVGAPGWHAGEGADPDGLIAVLFGLPGTCFAPAPAGSDDASQLLAGDRDTLRLTGAVAPAGDVDGDGRADLLHADSFTDTLLLFLGSGSGLGSPPASTLSIESVSFAAAAAPAGDVDGDGFDDVLVGAPSWGSDDGGLGGRVLLYAGSASGLPSSPAWTADGGSWGWQLGASLLGLADVNGDGFLDVAAGAPGASDALSGFGSIFIYFGGPAGLPGFPSRLLWVPFGDAPTQMGAGSVLAAGDLDGNSHADLLAGAPEWNASETGSDGRLVAWFACQDCDGSGLPDAPDCFPGDPGSDDDDDSAASCPDDNPPDDDDDTGPDDDDATSPPDDDDSAADDDDFSPELPVDVDGDGYASSDCDDSDPDVHPGAVDLKNGLDDDCDGQIDEDDPGGCDCNPRGDRAELAALLPVPLLGFGRRRRGDGGAGFQEPSRWARTALSRMRLRLPLPRSPVAAALAEQTRANGLSPRSVLLREQATFIVAEPAPPERRAEAMVSLRRRFAPILRNGPLLLLSPREWEIFALGVAGRRIAETPGGDLPVSWGAPLPAPPPEPPVERRRRRIREALGGFLEMCHGQAGACDPAASAAAIRAILESESVPARFPPIPPSSASANEQHAALLGAVHATLGGEQAPDPGEPLDLRRGGDADPPASSLRSAAPLRALLRTLVLDLPRELRDALPSLLALPAAAGSEHGWRLLAVVADDAPLHEAARLHVRLRQHLALLDPRATRGAGLLDAGPWVLSSASLRALLVRRLSPRPLVRLAARLHSQILLGQDAVAAAALGPDFVPADLPVEASALLLASAACWGPAGSAAATRDLLFGAWPLLLHLARGGDPLAALPEVHAELAARTDPALARVGSTAARQPWGDPHTADRGRPGEFLRTWGPQLVRLQEVAVEALTPA
jgi:hypothetical protein